MSNLFQIRLAAPLSAACVLSFAPRGAHAQWMLTGLNPQDAYASHAFAVRAGQQAGEAWIHGTDGMTTCAGIWGGSPQSWTSLNPAGSSQSMAFATDVLALVAAYGAFHRQRWGVVVLIVVLSFWALQAAAELLDGSVALGLVMMGVIAFGLWCCLARDRVGSVGQGPTGRSSRLHQDV